MVTKPSGQILYGQIKQIISTFPDWEKYQEPPRIGQDNSNRYSQLTENDRHWLLRAQVLVENSNRGLQEIHDFSNTVKMALNSPSFVETKDIRPTLERVLFDLELKLNLTEGSGFLAAGNEVNALKAISTVFEKASDSLTIVDPYTDLILFSDFLPQVPEDVSIQVLTRSRKAKEEVLPVLTRYKSDNPNRNISIKTKPQTVLHDRWIVVDATNVWLISQSFNGLAKNSSATITLANGEVAKLKLEATNCLWNTAEELK